MAAPMMHEQQSYGAPTAQQNGAQYPQQGYASPQAPQAPQAQQQPQHPQQAIQPQHPQGYTPQPQPSYTHEGTAPAVGIAAGRGPTQDWKTGFFDCFSPGDTCCLGYWCPCILFGKTQQRIKDPTMASYDTVNGNCMGFGALCICCCGFSFIFSMIKRGDMRQHYNLDGSGLGDCARAYCCQCCSLIQEEKEALLRNAELGYGAPAAAAPAQGYQKEPSMQYGAATEQKHA